MRYALPICAVAALSGPGVGWVHDKAVPPLTASEVLSHAQADSRALSQLRMSLHSPDPAVRLAAMTEMIISRNSLLIATAIDEGHQSKDSRLRDLSARAAFGELGEFFVEADEELPLRSESLARAIFSPEGLNGQVVKYVIPTGQFSLRSGGGQLSGSQFVFHTRFCGGALETVADSWVYAGVVTCGDGSAMVRVRMHVRIR